MIGRKKHLEICYFTIIRLFTYGSEFVTIQFSNSYYTIAKLLLYKFILANMII